MFRQKGRIVCLRVVDRLQRYIGIKQLWKPLKTVLDLCLGEIGELLICFQVLLWENALARTHLHIDCFISVHLSSYLLIFAWVRQRKRRQLIERVATLVQNPLMNTVVQPNEVETGQFRQFYPKLDNCEIMLEAILGFKSWMTRIVIIWIIPETAFLFRVDTRPCIYGINVMFIVQELQYVQGWEVFAPLATCPGQPDSYLVCRTYKELKMCRKRSFTFNLKIQHLFVTADHLPACRADRTVEHILLCQQQRYRHSTIYQYFVIYFCGEF